MKVRKIILFVIIIFSFVPHLLLAQTVYDLLDKTKIAYNDQNYYTALNLCRDILKLCEENPESECWYTNVMKTVYRYKGLAEFEIYKKEFKINRLKSAIQSLKASYNLYRDAEILYMYGYLLAIKSILEKNTTNLDGLVKAWKGILELYGNSNWIVTQELIDKIKDYIRIVEKFSYPKSNLNYSGRFACYMIIMACNLADKAQLSYDDKILFYNYRKKYQKDNLSR